MFAVTEIENEMGLPLERFDIGRIKGSRCTVESVRGYTLNQHRFVAFTLLLHIIAAADDGHAKLAASTTSTELSQ